jgi:hypothetical protein
MNSIHRQLFRWPLGRGWNPPSYWSKLSGVETVISFMFRMKPGHPRQENLDCSCCGSRSLAMRGRWMPPVSLFWAKQVSPFATARARTSPQENIPDLGRFASLLRN